MRGIGSVRAWGVLLFGAGLAAVAEEPPPLTPPALIAPGGAPAPTARQSPARPASLGPILIVPGVTAPARVRPMPRASGPAPMPAPTAPESSGGLPPLIGPGGPSEPRPIGASPRSAASTLTLESIPGSEPIVSTPAPTGPPPPPHPAFRPERPVPPPPTPTPRRPPGFLGRVLTPPSFLTGRNPAEPRGAITVEPRTDPAADAALKRRIERQIQEALGDRVRSVEVKVIGRDVTILARTTRFWQRRNVRRTLETLPGLSGYHATVAVDE